MVIDKTPTMCDSLILTRYLYSKIEVKQSLLISLLEQHYDESLFWAFELYFSGFQDDAFNFIIDMYDTLYAKTNPKLLQFITKQRAAWIIDNSQHWLFGSIVATLCHRNYSLSKFMQTYFGVKTTTIEQQNQTQLKTKKHNLCICLKSADIEQYKTIQVANPFHYLKTVCKYAARKEINQLFNIENADFRQQFWYSWQYYANRSPYWADIFEEYGGVANDETKTIDFDDDDCAELFNNDWNIDPDEQCKETQEKIIGNCSTVQLSIKEFCSKYGEQLKIKTKLKMVSIKPLTNSIVYTSNM